MGSTGKRNLAGLLRCAKMMPALLLFPPLAGCQLIAAPFMMWGEEPTKTVTAEYPHLEGKKLAVAIWADSDTLFEFPHVQLELSEFVASALKGNVRKLSFVPNRTVVDHQRANPEWDRKPPASVGHELGADRLMLIELTQYTTREPSSPHLYRGRIAANVKIYDSSAPDSGPTYRTTVEIVYPPDSPGEWGSSDSSIRDAAMRSFAAEVAGKFHERKVKAR